MNIGIIATAFGLMALAELPDKSMIATLLMGSRYRPVLVWAGASAAFTVHVVLAVVAGRLLELLPHRTLQIVVTVLFFAGAMYLLGVPEKVEEERAEAEVARETGPLPTTSAKGSRWRVPTGSEAGEVQLGSSMGRRVVATAFVVVLIGEFGDLTQLLMVNLVAKYHQPWSVLTGSLAALVSVAALGAFTGKALLRLMPVAILRRVGGLILIGFTAFSIYDLVR